VKITPKVQSDELLDIDKGEKKSVMIGFRLPMLAAVDRLGDTWQWTRNRVIEEACKLLLERERERGR
jgi:hypothetical protein